MNKLSECMQIGMKLVQQETFCEVSKAAIYINSLSEGNINHNELSAKKVRFTHARCENS